MIGKLCHNKFFATQPFGANVDKILVFASTFGLASEGEPVAVQLPDAQFNYGMMASEADDRFIYDNVVGSSTLGTLFYDVDGTGETG